MTITTPSTHIALIMILQESEIGSMSFMPEIPVERFALHSKLKESVESL